MKIPTVAVIHGFCLGGGLEVALACQSRIAIDGARFGFPEVMLGLHPGLGGTARFTHLVNPMQAMTLMLTGKTIDARKAKSLGLVDAVTQERHVRNAVKDAVFGRLKRAQPGSLNAVLNFAPVRGLLGSRMRSEAEKAAPHEHYPAPYALIDLWEKHGGDKSAMLAAEKTSFAGLMVTPTAQNLIRVFFLREQMKKLAGKRQQRAACPRHRRRRDGRRYRGVVRPSGHAGHAADMKPEPIAGAIKRAADLFGKIMRKRTDIRDALDRLIPDLDGEGVRNADLDHRGGAGKARAEAEGLCRARAEDEAGRDPGDQHLQHSAAGFAHHPATAGAAGRIAFLQSGVAAATGRGRQPRRRRSAGAASRRWPLSARSTGCRCRSRARRAFSSTAR